MANERMINSVSVGIVYVAGTGDYAISNDEKVHILAEIQDGLEALSDNEPRANLSWAYSSLSVNLPSFKPWEGANWPGLSEPFYRSIDDALWSGTTQKIYFFRGSEYIRVDPNNGWKADAGYPKPIAGNWPGFPASFASGINAALWSNTNQKIYFFKGSEYIRVDPNTGWNVDPGYPKPIAGNWPGFPDDFAQGVDGALWSGTNNKIYFFKSNRFYNQYIRVDPNSGWNVESGYPKPVGLGWEAEEKWRDPALTQLGFPTGGDGISQLTNFFQNSAGAQFGYVTFFTKMPTAWFAYAGGGRIVMRTSSGSFNMWTSIDSIFAHETGHIFGAPDEYASSNCACDGSHGSFFKQVNGNCDNCATTPVNCLMKNNTVNSLCEFTPAHIGWEAFLDKIDAGLYSFTNNKLYMFSQKYYVRYTDFNLDAGYPKPIAGNWPGFPANFAQGIDAALWSEPNQKIYFFKGNQYIRVDPNSGWNVDAGYPKPIAGNWPGFPANFARGIDAALGSKPNGKIYFFKGNQYIRVDPSTGWNVDPGYPKPIAGNWPGFPANFANGIDTAEWSESNQRIYFFKGTQYLRVNPADGWNVEGGYPRNININWRIPFPTAVV